MGYRSPGSFSHDDLSAVGILVANLGTPEASTAEALKPYLAEFLADPRVIELPRWRWLPILHLFVLTRRPAASAALYREIWTDEGSPLMILSERITAELETRLRRRTERPLHNVLGMRYGDPSLASALRELDARGCRRVLVLPLYPQYSGTSTASVFDAVFAELGSWRWVPELRTVNSYHDEPGYVSALAASVRERWEEEGRPEKLLFSFHGIPRRYFEDGDPYYCQCQKTARLVRERLDFPEKRTIVAFQSLFGREEWLKPYTDVTVRRLGTEGVDSLDVVCPGFAVDCLETLEEIDVQNREIFEEAGGGRFRFIPCLNDREDHLEFLTDLATRNLGGWLDAGEDPSRAAAARRERAKRQAEAYPAEITAP